jgi:O-antigen/teichoic acid export membrane protein
MADQVLSSATNFAVALVVARSLGTAEFGLFSLVFAVYLVALGVSRSLVTDPFLIRGRLLPPNAMPSAVGTSLTIGCVFAVIGVPASRMAGSAGGVVLAFSLLLPGLLVQDCVRYMFQGVGLPAQTARTDFVWACVQALAFAAVLIAGPTVSRCVVAWALAAWLSAVDGLWRLRCVPCIRAAPAWLRRHRDIGLPLLAEFAAANGAMQLTSVVIASVLTLHALGALQAAQLVLGPINVLLFGANLALLPEVARSVDDDPGGSTRLLARTSCALAAAAAVIGLSAAVLPVGIGRHILGPSWLDARGLVVPVALSAAGSGIAAGAAIGLRALGEAGACLRVRLMVALPLFVTASVLAWRIGVYAAAWGMAVITIGGSVVWWRQYKRALQWRVVPTASEVAQCA